MLITYNHEKYIAQALDSVLMQETRYRFEINVIEDCSTDRTQEIVRDYAARYPEIVKPFFNAVNIGNKVTQRNTYRGFKTLTGEYFAILEGDDYWLDRHRLQKQVAFLDAHPDFAICAGNTIKIYEGATGEPHRFLYWGKRADAGIEDVINLNPFFHNAGVLFRNVYNGDPPRQFSDRQSCDIFITIAHAQFGKVHHMDEDFAVYRAHPGGRFSNRPKIEEWMFDINGLRQFNSWLGYQYARAFSRSIVKYCSFVLSEEGRRESGRLDWYHSANIQRIRACYGVVYCVLDLPRLLAKSATRIVFLCAGPVYSVRRLVDTPRTSFLGWHPTLFVARTSPSRLPVASQGATWRFVCDLNIRQTERDRPCPAQPVLRLAAVRSGSPDGRGCHGLGIEYSGLKPGVTYRVGLWVGAVADANVQVQLRDASIESNTIPENECEVWFDPSWPSVRLYRGDLSDTAIEREANGWSKAWIDFRTGSGLISVYLGLVERVNNSPVFRGVGEWLVLGGIEVVPTPDHGVSPRLISGVVGKSPQFNEGSSDLAARSLLWSRSTRIGELPRLPDLTEWHLVWDLEIRVVAGGELFPGLPVLDLLAVPTRTRHALSLCLSGIAPNAPHRLMLWVKPVDANTDVHVQSRDSDDRATGKPAHECDVWFRLSTAAVHRVAYGNPTDYGIRREAEGWCKVWMDVTTNDGRLYVYLGLVDGTLNSNVFTGGGERLLFGGLALEELPVAQ